MQRFITDERTGIRYELIGDYYYPCLTVEKSPPLSKYGLLRQRYLREHKRVLYFNLLTSGKLYEHLAEIDTSARDMAEYLIKEMAKKQGVTEELPTLTKYGRMRERYLREHRKILYINLLTSGKLYEHLADIDTSACDMAEYLIKEMARKQGVTEELKGKDMMKWIGLMNNIRACADEIVLNDIVYS